MDRCPQTTPEVLLLPADKEGIIHSIRPAMIYYSEVAISHGTKKQIRKKEGI